MADGPARLATLARGTYRVVSGAGHYIFRDNPAAAATAISTVLTHTR